MKRILLAAILGGLLLFIWEFVSHDMLPLGEAGVRAVDNETAMMGAIKANASQDGFYIVPAPSQYSNPAAFEKMTSDQKKQDMEQHMAKMASGPSGVLILHPNGFPSNFATQLATQFICDIIVVLLAAVLLSHAPGLGYGGAVLFVAALGVIPTLRADLPYWNWYGFPTTYTAGQFAMHFIGFALVGLVLGKMVRAKG